MPTENAPCDHTEAEAAEQLALEAAIAEADASGPGVPHEVVRERLLEMVSQARARIAELKRREAAFQQMIDSAIEWRNTPIPWMPVVPAAPLPGTRPRPKVWD